MKRGALIAFVFGLALFIALVVWQGAGAILQALEVAGWGMLLVAAWHLVPLTMDSAGQWYALPLRDGRSPRFVTVLRARWVGESVNTLLPVAQMGGLFVMVRLLAQNAYPGTAAGAGVTVGTTQQMLAQMAFAVIGVLLLVTYTSDAGLLWGLIGGILLFSAFAGWFYHVQRRDLFVRIAGLLSKTFGGGRWLDFSGGAQALDVAVHDAYADAGRVRRSFGCYFVGWMVGFGEVWIALDVLGHPVAWTDALLIESMTQAIIGMAFVVPGALGVQEGGYVLLGALVGVPADAAIAVSLIRRVRQLVLGIPGLVSWQYFEGRKLRRARSDGMSATAESAACGTAARPSSGAGTPSAPHSPD